jgi:hypothetical protein
LSANYGAHAARAIPVRTPTEEDCQVQGGLAIVAIWQGLKRMRGFFLRMCVILKIFSENLRLFLKISILFEDIFRKIEAF